ncbi:hypothetical protein [Streptomyces sp. NPDC029003]|uniref:hypothetical protein n=1 Tax=Streptomyces sp. NPDC029003 TaxID=3155125 RepID=UPI0033D7194A
MAGRHRYHLDQDGHSLTVLYDVRGHRVEVLVDGRTVSTVPASPDVLVLRGQIPADPPLPFLIRIGRPYDRDDVPPCVLERDGMRYLMPNAPLTPEEEWPAEHDPAPRTPGELLARWRARYRRRRTPR